MDIAITTMPFVVAAPNHSEYLAATNSVVSNQEPRSAFAEAECSGR